MHALIARIIFSVFELLFERLVEIIFGAIKKAVVGWGRTITAAFRESKFQGLLCLFPLYAVYYATRLERQHSEFKWVITEFMEAVAARNVKAAYACWSPQSATKEEIVGVIESSCHVFAGYERLTINSSRSGQSSGGIDSWYVNGDVIYTGDRSLPFEAWLVKENSVWKITGIQIGSIVGATAKRWSSKKTRIVAISVGVLAAAVLVPGLVHMFQFFSGVEPAVAQFMEAGVTRNVEAAYACWSPQSATEEEIAEFIESSHDVFAGYERLTISSKNGQSGGGIESCYVSGAIIYTGGQRLSLEASLVKDNEVWKITGVRIGSAEAGIVEQV